MTSRRTRSLAAGLVAALAAAGVALAGGASPAGAVVLPVDIRVEHDVPDMPSAGPRVLEVIGVTAGPGPEITAEDETENPQPWTGNVLVDIDPLARTITVATEEQNCYGLITVRITTPDIASVEVLSDDLFASPIERDESVTDGVVELVWADPLVVCAPLAADGEAVFSYEMNPAPESECSDVPRGVYYTAAFDWAWYTGVTTGVGGTTMCEPLRDVTRAEAVTILWRSAGSPVVATPHPFTDTIPGAFYQAALRWAADEGLTTGIGGSPGNPSETFDPDGVVDRAQQFTFVWRMVGEPAGAPNSFVDVVEGSFYEKAADWAQETGATTGYAGSDRFEPHINVDRAQQFTIAHRVFGF